MKDLGDWACIGSSKRQKEREGEKGRGGGGIWVRVCKELIISEPE